jgi:hypothetical protein
MQRHEDLLDVAEIARGDSGWTSEQAMRGADFVRKESTPLIWGSAILLGICGAFSFLAYGIPKWTRAQAKEVSPRARDVIPSKLRKAARLTRSPARNTRHKRTNSSVQSIR